MAGVSSDWVTPCVAYVSTHVSPMSRLITLAEREGFEPSMGCPIPHFQCGALGH
jgi:hypothetical protein